MFDEADLDGQSAEGGPPLGAGDLADVGRDAGPTGQVGAHEDHPAGRGGRQESQTHLVACQEAESGDFGGAEQGPLRTKTMPSHDGLDSWAGRR
jgi:hypothetical protein